MVQNTRYNIHEGLFSVDEREAQEALKQYEEAKKQLEAARVALDKAFWLTTSGKNLNNMVRSTRPSLSVDSYGHPGYTFQTGHLKDDNQYWVERNTAVETPVEKLRRMFGDRTVNTLLSGKILTDLEKREMLGLPPKADNAGKVAEETKLITHQE